MNIRKLISELVYQGWNSQTWDIRWIYLIPAFDLIGGGPVVMTSLLYTYISEGVEGGNLFVLFFSFSNVFLA